MSAKQLILGTQGNTYEIITEAGKSYIIWGKVSLNGAYQNIYDREDLFPNENLLPWDGIYPAYQIKHLDASDNVLKTDTFLIGAGDGIYDILSENIPVDGTVKIVLEPTNSQVLELLYVEYSHLGSVTMKMKIQKHWKAVANAWCKIDDNWEPIIASYGKKDDAWRAGLL